jgi:hypothetical protein
MNTGPLPDGSIHPVDAKTLKEVGRRIREKGWPAPVAPPPPPPATKGKGKKNKQGPAVQ